MEIGQGIRQGDVLLRKVKALPKNVQPRTGSERIVVEYGEATGHAHTLDPQAVEAYDVVSAAAGAIVGQAFRVLERTTIDHQEHGSLVLDPGFYERWYQFEDDGESERQTRD